jgi:1-acyl-sn-glycerol-3-phosphate acyltransferase
MARWYARWRIRRSLDGLFAGGLDPVRDLLSQGPVIFAANHVGWWDGLAMLVLDGVTGAEGHFLMDAENLARMPYARPLGAIALDRRSPVSPRAGLRAAADMLSDPGRAVWVFPQGEHRAAHLRPLGLKRGVEMVHGRSGAPVVPVSIQYGFGEHPVPRVAVRFGDALRGREGLIDRLEAQLAEGIDWLDIWFDGGEEALVPVVPTRRVRPQDRTAARLLAVGIDAGAGRKGD